MHTASNTRTYRTHSVLLIFVALVFHRRSIFISFHPVIRVGFYEIQHVTYSRQQLEMVSVNANTNTHSLTHPLAHSSCDDTLTLTLNNILHMCISCKAHFSIRSTLFFGVFCSACIHFVHRHNASDSLELCWIYNFFSRCFSILNNSYVARLSSVCFLICFFFLRPFSFDQM